MSPANARSSRLSEFVDSLQATGKYVFTREQACAAVGISAEGLKKSARRLVGKRRLSVPHRGFFVIVPLEHRQAGAPPPSWYIDDLMGYLRRQYYVGLLTAAALHGAGHQQPQEFQIVVDRQLRPIAAGRGRLRFFRKLRPGSTPVVLVATETGTMPVSTPEATAFDLLRYPAASGQLGQVATVLSDLVEAMDPGTVVEVAERDGDVATAQRLGFVLDHVGAHDISNWLADWIADQGPRYALLRPGQPAGTVRDRRWRIFVNEEIEVDD